MSKRLSESILDRQVSITIGTRSQLVSRRAAAGSRASADNVTCDQSVGPSQR